MSVAAMCNATCCPTTAGFGVALASMTAGAWFCGAVELDVEELEVELELLVLLELGDVLVGAVT